MLMISLYDNDDHTDNMIIKKALISYWHMNIREQSYPVCSNPEGDKDCRST